MKRLAAPTLVMVAALVIWASVTPRPQRVAAVTGGSAPERIWTNDNREPAGDLEAGVLTLWLEAREGLWYPEGPDGKVYTVAAFAEEGGPLLNPGPLIRVPVGTEIRMRVRNSLRDTLTMFGLGEVRLDGAGLAIEPAGVRELRFVTTTPGTYYYAGKTDSLAPTRFGPFGRRREDSQLNGVIVVDPAGMTPRPDERIFLISWWIAPETTEPGGLAPVTAATILATGTTLVINGRSWPHNERIEAAQGDTLHWKWISMTAAPHPLHLHGHYFRVDAKGDGVKDTIYSSEQQRLAVTETLLAGQTMSIAWSPERVGNWIFHCHLATHITPGVPEDGTARETDHRAHSGSDPTQHAMSRLVLGIRVQRRGRPEATIEKDYRSIRLLIRSRPRVYGESPGYAYVLGGSAEEADPSALPVPGPTLVLKKGEPVAINLVNRTHEPAAVHWHGIELESFPDGVPGWSGAGDQILPAIQPGDSLTVRFTPPRAGTFMYHSHFNELQQISSGLYGAIMVLEPGQRYDPETDRILLFSDPDPAAVFGVNRPGSPPMLNGNTNAQPVELSAGETYRFRIINIRSNYTVGVELLDGDRVLQWRRVAKDGADLPASQATLGPAFLSLGVGEIHDVAFTPQKPGTFTLRFGFPPALRPPPIPPVVLLPPPTMVDVHVK